MEPAKNALTPKLAYHLAVQRLKHRDYASAVCQGLWIARVCILSYA
jgi:hypothetical protein